MMRKILKAGLPFFVGVLLSNGANAQSIQQAIDAAIASEPGMLANNAGLNMARAKLKAVKANEGASIGLQGSYGAQNADFGMGYDVIYPRSLAIAWEKRLYDGGAALARISAEEFALAEQNAANAKTKNDLIVETVAAYSNVYVAQKMVLFAKDNLEATTRFARDAELQFKAGETAISEKALAEAAKYRAEAMLAQMQGNEKIAKANLERLTGTEFTVTNLDGGNLVLPPNVNEAKTNAKAAHPMNMIANARYEQAKAQTKIANSYNLPKVSIEARATTIRDQFLSGYKVDDYGAYLKFSMPLWDNGRTKSAKQMALYGSEQAKYGLYATQKAIELGITEAFANYDVALAALKAARSANEAMKIAAKSVEAEFRVGQKPMSDLLDAQKNLTESQGQMAKAEAECLVAKYKVIAASGGNF